ncbi:ANTAR domain-containing protein [Amycolatopsis keratiniphila]|uniref:ANTAR domain-containing protein n=1 Tax=Amycolatopsis keratiniphila TaxID=129921 RepID=UPI000907A020|nr:ANTAR domain-containing protein [Amycolatopsis keratiniphila]OLZ60691.1 hypothetical protein BS330_03415 [Amycolatopsis keratiniphila subsp. nogabecina]
MPTRHDLLLAQTLADTAVLCLRQRRVLLGKDAIIDQLQTALDSRIVIEQAKGFLAAHCQITVDEAFHRLRNHSRNNHHKLSDLATQIAQGTIPTHFGPPPRRTRPLDQGAVLDRRGEYPLPAPSSRAMMSQALTGSHPGEQLDPSSGGQRR